MIDYIDLFLESYEVEFWKQFTMITTSKVFLHKQIPINYDNTYLGIMFTGHEVHDAMKTLRISVSLP